MGTTSQSQLRRWEAIIAEFNRSNLGVTTFCRERGLNKNNFYYWKKRIAGINLKKVLKTKSAFLPVVIDQSQSFIGKPGELNRALPDAKWAAEFAAHLIRSLS